MSNLYIINYDDLHKNMKDILEIYNRIKIQVINLLLSDSEKIENTLWDNKKSSLIDKECRCKILHTDYLEPSHNLLDMMYEENYSCCHCTILHRLLSRTHENDDYPIITISNKKYRIIQYGKVNPIINNNLTTDKYTNIILSNWYIEYILSQKYIKTTLNLTSSFICGNIGYLIYEEPDYNNLDDFVKNKLVGDKNENETVLYGILLQLFSTLDVLSKYSVSIFNISNDIFTFISSPIQYNYDNMNIVSNITLKLKLNDGACIDVNNLRLNRFNSVNDTLSKYSPYQITIKNMKYMSCNDRGICREINKCYYTIEHENSNYRISNAIFRKNRSDGTIKNSSFESYMFMIILMSNKKIRDIVNSNEFLLNIWKDLWVPNQYKLIEKEIDKLHNIDTIKLESIISTYKLRCDVTKFIWNSMKG